MTDFRKWAERHGERFVPEKEFRAASHARRQRLADAIAASGLSYNHIANGARICRKVVSRAAKGIEIRQEAFDRIEYYMGLISNAKWVETGEIIPLDRGVIIKRETFETK